MKDKLITVLCWIAAVLFVLLGGWLFVHAGAQTLPVNGTITVAKDQTPATPGAFNLQAIPNNQLQPATGVN